MRLDDTNIKLCGGMTRLCNMSGHTPLWPSWRRWTGDDIRRLSHEAQILALKGCF